MLEEQSKDDQLRVAMANKKFENIIRLNLFAQNIAHQPVHL